MLYASLIQLKSMILHNMINSDNNNNNKKKLYI